MVEIIIKIVASVVVGTVAGFSIVYIFNRMPARWLCDYGEKPPRELTDPHIQRVKGFPWRWIYAAGFACLLVRLSFFDVRMAAAGLFACWAMMMIGLADLKYMVIPDQFVIMLALSAFGFIPYHSSVWQPLLGALIGGGVMMMVAVLGGAAFKGSDGVRGCEAVCFPGSGSGSDGDGGDSYRSLYAQRYLRCCGAGFGQI